MNSHPEGERTHAVYHRRHSADRLAAGGSWGRLRSAPSFTSCWSSPSCCSYWDCWAAAARWPSRVESSALNQGRRRHRRNRGHRQIRRRHAPFGTADGTRHEHRKGQSAGRKAGARVDAGQCAEAGDRVLCRAAGSVGRVGARRVRHLRASRLVVRSHLQRSAHSRHHPGDLRVSPAAPHRRTAVPGHGHPRAVRAGVRERARGPRGQRRRGHDRPRSRLHAHAASFRTPSFGYNRGRTSGLADGIVITPSHNPPEDGGFKYNPPNGGPADDGGHRLDRAERERAARDDLRGVRRMPYERARRASTRISTITSRLRGRSGERGRHGRRSVAPACGSEWIRLVGPACTTGGRSSRATASR